MCLTAGHCLIVSGLGRTTRALLLWHADSLVVVRRFSTCSEVSHGMCHIPCPMACGIFILRLEIELMSPVLHGGFLTTGPLRKSLLDTLK